MFSGFNPTSRFCSKSAYSVYDFNNGGIGDYAATLTQYRPGIVQLDKRAYVLKDLCYSLGTLYDLPNGIAGSGRYTGKTFLVGYLTSSFWIRDVYRNCSTGFTFYPSSESSGVYISSEAQLKSVISLQSTPSDMDTDPVANLSESIVVGNTRGTQSIWRDQQQARKAFALPQTAAFYYNYASFSNPYVPLASRMAPGEIFIPPNFDYLVLQPIVSDFYDTPLNTSVKVGLMASITFNLQSPEG